VNAVLLARHHELDIDPALPSMLALLRVEWISKVLGDYLPSNTWQRNIRQACNKQAYLMAHIVKRCDADATLLVLASAKCLLLLGLGGLQFSAIWKGDSGLLLLLLGRIIVLLILVVNTNIPCSNGSVNCSVIKIVANLLKNRMLE
jgi:hypothetical protein